MTVETKEAPSASPGNDGSHPNALILAAFTVLGIIVAALLPILLPNLSQQPLYLVLLIATSIVTGVSLGLRFSGMRKQLSKTASRTLSGVLIALVVADLLLLVAPVFLPGKAANEKDPFAAAAQPTAMVKPSEGAMMAKPTGDAMMKPSEGAMMAKPTGDAMAKPSEGAMMAKPTGDAMAKPSEGAMMKPSEAAMTAPATTAAMTAAPTTVAPTTVAPTTAAPTVAPTTAAPTVAPLRTTGEFSGRGNYKVAGTAVLGTTPDGKNVLRFENFNSSNGPDLVVYLVKDSTPNGVNNGIQIAPLRATQGNLNLELPADLKLSDYKSVVIWCRAFSVTFGVASLK